MAKYFHQKFVIFDKITESFLVEKWRTLGDARRCICKNLLNLGFQDNIHFSIYQVGYKWRVSFPFSAKYYDRNFKCLFWKFVFQISNLRGIARLPLKCSIWGTNNQLPNIFYKFVHLQLFNVKHKIVHLQVVWH